MNDFDNDGDADVVWRNLDSGMNVLWTMEDTALISYAFLPDVADTNWNIFASADYDADGNADLVWRNTATGENLVWFMDGATMLGWNFLPAITDLSWQLVGPAPARHSAFGIRHSDEWRTLNVIATISALQSLSKSK